MTRLFTDRRLTDNARIIITYKILKGKNNYSGLCTITKETREINLSRNIYRASRQNEFYWCFSDNINPLASTQK